jgi:hypothetical protein
MPGIGAIGCDALSQHCGQAARRIVPRKVWELSRAARVLAAWLILIPLVIRSFGWPSS